MALLPVATPLLSGRLLLAVVLFELIAVGPQVGLATAAGALPLLPIAARRRHGGESSGLLASAPLRLSLAASRLVVRRARPVRLSRSPTARSRRLLPMGGE